MELNIVSITYLFLRLAPFILVSFFSLASIFNQDFKGIVYLVGLLFACFLNILLGEFFQISNPDKPEICNMITINQSGEISKLPLSQAVFGYTFSYLFYTIYKYNYFYQNISTLLFFPTLIIFDMIWNMNNGCYRFVPLFLSLLFASIFGVFWGYLIDSMNSKNLQYFVGVNNKEVCNAASASTFKCAVYKNGQLISKNFSTPKE